MTIVDIIITCYNKETTVARAIRAVKSQTLQDFNCIIVNDGSTDNSKEKILAEIDDDQRFTYLELENCGVANARNSGIQLGKSPYISCLDGDDGLHPAFLKTCVNALNSDKSLGIAYTDVLLFHVDGEFTTRKWSNVNYDKQFIGDNQVPCCNVFRRELFERTGGYRQRCAPSGAGAEDAELWLRAFELGFKAQKVTNEPLFIYSMGTGITAAHDYTEIDWTSWHTNHQKFASLKTPTNNIAHPALEYDRPEISIIIPVGPNHEHYLVDALDSVEAQTFRNWECIVIFDGGNEQKELELSKFIFKSFPYVKFYSTLPLDNKKLYGAGYARNLGVNYSQGEFLVFLDADDYLQKRFLELTVSAIKHFDADWIYTDLYTQTIYNEAQYNLKINELDSQGLFHQELLKKDDTIEFVYEYQCDEWDVNSLWRDGLAGITGLYRRSHFDSVNGFDEQNNREDWDFHCRLAQAGKCGLRLPLPLYTYRLHTGIRREYKDIATNANESKQLKLQDVKRIHQTYNKEKLIMACSKCKKNKINIQSTSNKDLTTLYYIAQLPISSGVLYRGITGKRYPVQEKNSKLFIEKVQSQDAQHFIQRGLFEPSNEEQKREILTSVTPRKINITEKLTPQERLRIINEQNMENKRLAMLDAMTDMGIPVEETEFKPQGKESVIDEIEGWLTKTQSDNIEQDEWWRSPENYTIKELNVLIETATQHQIEQLIISEQQGKVRKTLLNKLERIIKQARYD